MIILLLTLNIILGLDFYIRHKKLVKKTIRDILRKIRGEEETFSIKKKGVGDKVIEELEKQDFRI